MNYKTRSYHEYTKKSENIHSQIVLLLSNKGAKSFDNEFKWFIQEYIMKYLLNGRETVEFNLTKEDFIAGLVFKIYTSDNVELNIIKNQLLNNNYENDYDYLHNIIKLVVEEIYNDDFIIKSSSLRTQNGDFIEEELDCYDILVNIGDIVNTNTKINTI